MRTVLVGNRALAKHVLTFLLEEDWPVVGAVSPGDDAARRQAGYVPLDDVVESHDVELIRTSDINDDETRTRLASLEPDICICPGWHQIIDEAVLEIPDRGFVGFHASDLPRGRGGAPVNWTIIEGATEIPATLFYYDTGVDAGDVIHKEFVDVEDRDAVDTVLDKLATAARDALAATRDGLESGTPDATPQAIGDATYRPRRQPQDGIVDWSRSAPALFDWVRAQTDPYPGAYTFLDGQRLAVWSADVPERTALDAEPGDIVRVREGEGVDVATGDGVLRLERVQLEGAPRAWADDLAVRNDLDAGDALGRDHAPPEWLYTGIRDGQGGNEFSTATNLRVGERGTVQAVLASGTRRDIDLRATFAEETIHQSKVVTDGWVTVELAYEPVSAGTHTLRVEFRAEERADTRYLKVFATD